jgi:hypothetical protein
MDLARKISSITSNLEESFMEKLKQDKLQSRYGKFLKVIEFFLAITGAG